ncbi:PDF receptor-like [Cydia pomonella]|uniref:PDF receptor-like n=1 Tax=Cydia pomonella TaxID=82600 RepID=UPI002ADE21A3|nr:PDF receptor-like [Cydia pomonella]
MPMPGDLDEWRRPSALCSVAWAPVLSSGHRTSLTLSAPEARDGLLRLFQQCLLKYAHFLYNPETVYCNATFDSYLCWPPTPAGEVASQHCPPARLSDTSRFAYRQCEPSGLWQGRRPNESSAVGWTNYTPCFPQEVQNLFVKVYDNEHVAQLKFEIALRTRYMEIAGFSISLIALVVSLFIFSYYRSLRNNRTRIHKSLFSAMVLQVLIRLTVYIDQALVRSWRGDRAANDTLALKGIDNMPYLCESSYILLEYAITVMFMWMFIEGLYLHNVVTANALREGISHVVYYATGWGLPVILTAVWAAMSALHYKGERVNTCWYGYNFSPLYWIMQGPRLGVILINLVFLLNIMKVLIVKLRSSESSELEKIRKAVRAALVLLPLLGITNIINMTEAPLDGSVWTFALWSYTTHFLRSFQGFFIALIYCFLNGEVRQVLQKHYSNYRAMRGNVRRHRDSFFNFLSSSGGEHKPSRIKNKKSDEMEFAEALQLQGETNMVQTNANAEYVTETV